MIRIVLAAGVIVCTVGVVAMARAFRGPWRELAAAGAGAAAFAYGAPAAYVAFTAILVAIALAYDQGSRSS